jgi:hypothetical protein
LPEKLYIDSGRTVFMEENRSAVYWSVPASRDSNNDVIVFQGINRREKSVEWHPENDSCFTFLRVMAIWNASYGGACAHTAMGYVDERAARILLDEQWEFVGEVNEMRAYIQSGRAVCFLKWEDIFQKKLNLSPWRVFAVADSADELKLLQLSMPAKWE